MKSKEIKKEKQLDHYNYLKKRLSTHELTRIVRHQQQK